MAAILVGPTPIFRSVRGHGLRRAALPAAALAGLAAVATIASLAAPGRSPASLLFAPRRLRTSPFARTSPLADPKTTELRATGYAPTCTHEVIDALASIMEADVVKNGLRPASVLGNLGELELSGLDEHLVRRAFVGNRLAVVGDSTLMRFHVHLYFVVKLMLERDPFVLAMWQKDNDKTRFDGRIRPLKDNSMNVWSNMQSHVLTVEGDDDDGDGNGDAPTQIMYARIHEGPELDDATFRRSVVDFRPRVVLANIGLHLFHFKNWGDFYHDHTVWPWLQYEASLEKLIRMAEEARAEVLLFKTTNFVCDGSYVGKWKEGNKLYLAGDDKTLDDCVSSHREENPDAEAVTDEDIRHFCRNGVINERSGRMLNMRMFRFVEEARQRHKDINIAIFDDYGLQSCSSTAEGDGRHHFPVILPRIRLLGNQLDCMFNATQAAMEY